MIKRRSVDIKKATKLIDEAVQMLRAGGLSMVLPYYVGAIPFVMGLWFFYADMSRSAFAQDRCVSAALGMALLFIWMKIWQAVYTQIIWTRIMEQPGPSPVFAAKILASQAFIHSLGIIILPLAAIMVLPFFWVCAFFQNTTCINHKKHQGLKNICTEAWKQAGLWPRQNFGVICVLFIFSIFVFLNIGIFVAGAPVLLKKFLGIETLFAMGLYHSVNNTTFWTITAGLTYLCVDPLLKAVYVLRCFYGASIISGDDIRAKLRALFPLKIILAIMLILASFLYAPNLSMAQPMVTETQLEQAIKEIMQKPMFAWKTPHEKAPEQAQEELAAPGFLYQVFKWAKEILDSSWDTIKGWYKSIKSWLDRLWPVSDNMDKISDMSDHNWPRAAHLLLYAMLALTASILAIMGLRVLRARMKMKKAELAPATANPEKINLLDEQIGADKLSTNAWLELATQLMKKGAFLEALRAFYLAVLSDLSTQQFISIARYKSNQDYQRELVRRGHSKKELPDLFAQSVESFEKFWYGMHFLTKDEVDRFAACQNRIMTIARDQ